MRERGWGRIIGSSSTEVNYGRSGPYAASHAKTEQYLRALSCEEAKHGNLHTVSLRLGSLGNASNWWRFFDDPEGQLERLKKQIPRGKLMSCEEVAHMFLEYLCSPVLMPIQSGSAIQADAGYRLQKGERRQ